MNCIFCNSEEIASRKIVDTELSWAFPTNIPITIGHTLVSPKRCVQKIDELNSDELIDLKNLIKIIKKALSKTFKSEGFNIAWNEGKIAGQSIPHLHIHVVPRVKNDEGIYGYEPRKFLYRPGSREVTPQEELVKVAEEIKKSL